MIFSSIPFLYYFLPTVILLYFIVPKQMANSVLLLASLFFYGYGEPRYLLLISIAIFMAWGFGLLIPRNKIYFYLSVFSSLAMLGWFKYADFFIESFGKITGISVETLGIALPIGISFYTFQILSYTADLYLGKIKPQKNLINFATYVALFPQLIAGPIVVYSTIEAQLDYRNRGFHAANVYEGAQRFVLGLGKKVMLANGLGELVKLFGELEADEKTVTFYWMYAIAFTMQIYFDFSGYSDMAIGLGKIFGFSFPENFNYPYIAKSITDFWRRWHMTLGGWFREYVYIPLGGNRVGNRRWMVNLFIVWGLTGLWHGAAWTFVCWGLFHGVALMMEKLWLGKYLKKAPAAVSHIYVLLLVVISMVIFNAADMGEAMSVIGAMFGFGEGLALSSELTMYYLRSYGVLFVLGILGSLPLVKRLAVNLKGKIREKAAGEKILAVIEPMLVIALLLLVTAYLVDGSFNPFLYFRF